MDTVRGRRGMWKSRGGGVLCGMHADDRDWRRLGIRILPQSRPLPATGALQLTKEKAVQHMRAPQRGKLYGSRWGGCQLGRMEL